MKSASPRHLLLAVALALAGCAGQPEGPGPAEAPARDAVPGPAAEPEDEVARLLALAARSDPSAAVDAKLAAAAELLRRGDTGRATALLDELESVRLDSPQWIRHSVLRARLELASGAADAALARLSNPALQSESTGVDRALQLELAFARADALAALQRHLESARERTAVQAWLSDDGARRANTRAIFSALSGADMGTLERAIATAASDDWRGWLELAATVRDLRRAPAEQAAALAHWERRYALIAPLQSAARELLPDIRARIAQPARVALLLPLGGKAAASAEAVMHGYLAEHLRQLSAGEQPPPVAVIDTAAFPGGFAAAYASAVADGATMVIGPLLKEELEAFGPALQPSVPTLALNFSDTLAVDGAALYAFGLDGADEVAQLAAAARARGFAHVLVLTDDAEPSRRQAAEFARLWRDRGARVLATLRLGELNDFRERFEQALLFEQSRERSAALSQLLGQPLVAEPRRRHDLDLVVMLAGPVASRSIRPLASFLYAGDLPVWATSQSSGARRDQRNDRDLEGVRFLDLPWFSGAELRLRETIGDGVPPGGLQRLAAVGADACRLQSRIGLLDWSDVALSGATGELALDPARHVRRHSPWYQFSDGIAVPEIRRAASPALAANSRSTEGETTWTDAEVRMPAPSAEPRKTVP